MKNALPIMAWQKSILSPGIIYQSLD